MRSYVPLKQCTDAATKASDPSNDALAESEGGLRPPRSIVLTDEQRAKLEAPDRHSDEDLCISKRALRDYVVTWKRSR